MRRFRLHWESGAVEVVAADFFTLEDGAIVFVLRQQSILTVADGEWISCREVPPSEH